MSRIRSIKPDWLDDAIALKDSDTRVLSVGMMLVCDDAGRGRAEAGFLHHRIFPGQPIEVLARGLIGLASLRYMGLYVVTGQKYFAIRNWLKHQRIEHPSDPKVPPPSTEGALIYATLGDFVESEPSLMKAHEQLMPSCDPIHLPSLLDLTYTRNKPVRSGRGKTWRRVPVDWAPNQGHRDLATMLGVNFELEVAKFRDHEFDRPKTDPDRTFRNWLRTAAGYARKGGPKPPQPSHGKTGWERKTA